MARVGNTVNLVGNSRYDVLLYDFPDGYPIGAVQLKFGTTPKKISGVEKVSQVFMKCLLSGRGSDVIYNNYGTNFPQLTGTYNLQNIDAGDARSLIYSSVAEAERQAKGILNVASADYTSQLESATVISAERQTDSTKVQIVLLTRAGEKAPIALPFTSIGLEVNE